MLNDVEATKVFLPNPNSEIIFALFRTFSCFIQIGVCCGGSPGSVLTVTFATAAAGLILAHVDLCHLGLGLGCTSTESTFVTLFALTLSAAGVSGFALTITLTGGDFFGKGKGDGDFNCDLLDLLFCGGVCDLDLDLDLLWCDFLRRDFLWLFFLLLCECFFLFLW